MATDPTLIVNLARGNLACEHAVIADRPLRRMRGLLGRRELPAGAGLLLQPAPSIHTAFMRFPIDVVFLDRNLQVLKVVEAMPAWRTASARRARSVLELAAGEIGSRGIAVGDRLAVVGASAGAPVAQIATPGAEHADDEATATNGGGATSSAGRDEATRVLLLGSDRRFRSVAALLLTRRGCAVELGAGRDDELCGLRDVDVVVLDTGGSPAEVAREAAQIERADPPVGVVVVGEAPGAGRPAMPVLAKWGAFDALYTAIERARPERAARSLDARR